VGQPEIICHYDGEGGGCYYVGADDQSRVCEACGADEPADETATCPKCGCAVWWVPKCPRCGKPCTWTYGIIKPREYEKIMAAREFDAAKEAK
jgi:hypothetical protein